MNYLPLIKQLRLLGEQRQARTERELRQAQGQIEELQAALAACDERMGEYREAIARMHAEVGLTLDRAAFFERKRKEAVLLSKLAAQRMEREGLEEQESDVQRHAHELQQVLDALQAKEQKWEKVEQHLRRQQKTHRLRLTRKAIENSVACKQLHS
ncbi:hypothetical protein NUH87_31060 [Pseudomonas batumici]|uniref:hypothetical protein n=1 Tax=Pseudomonas batumici TaxID=226910 RepID=UPI0030D5727A